MEINIPTAEEARKALNARTVKEQLEKVSNAINQGIKEEKKHVFVDEILMSEIEKLLCVKGYEVVACGKKTQIIWEK